MGLNLEDVAEIVDLQVCRPPADRIPARLYGVRALDGTFVAELLGTGDAHDLARRIRPPAGLVAIAMACGAWAAPMDEDGNCSVRPSLHPERRHIHITALVGGDGQEASVIRYPDREPLVGSGGIGRLPEGLLRCWSRRRDAPRPARPSEAMRSRVAR